MADLSSSRADQASGLVEDNVSPEMMKRRYQALQEFQALIDRKAHHKGCCLAGHRVDPAYLELFLKWSKWNVEKAHERYVVTAQFIHRHEHRLGCLHCLHPEEFQDLHNQGWLRILGRDSKDGYALITLAPAKLGQLNQHKSNGTARHTVNDHLMHVPSSPALGQPQQQIHVSKHIGNGTTLPPNADQMQSAPSSPPAHHRGTWPDSTHGPGQAAQGPGSKCSTASFQSADSNEQLPPVPDESDGSTEQLRPLGSPVRRMMSLSRSVPDLATLAALEQHVPAREELQAPVAWPHQPDVGQCQHRLPGQLRCNRSGDQYLRFLVWLVYMAADLYPSMASHGVMLLESFQGWTWSHVLSLAGANTQDSMQLCLTFLRTCSPLRLKGLLVLDHPRSLGMAWTLVKPFLGPKIASRVSFLGKDARALHQVVGGTAQVPTAMFYGAHPDMGEQWWADVTKHYDKQHTARLLQG